MQSGQDNGGKPKLNIKHPRRSPRCINLAVVTHSQTEFILEFIQVMPGTPKTKVRSAILSPQHAKRVMKMLVDNIGKFEAQHGTIDMTSPGRAVVPDELRWADGRSLRTAPISSSGCPGQ